MVTLSLRKNEEVDCEQGEKIEGKKFHGAAGGMRSANQVPQSFLNIGPFCLRAIFRTVRVYDRLSTVRNRGSPLMTAQWNCEFLSDEMYTSL
jgi:hypothetical protein